MDVYPQFLEARYKLSDIEFCEPDEIEKLCTALSIGFKYQLRLRKALSALQKERKRREKEEESAAAQGAVSHATVLLNSKQHGQLQVLYQRFRIISEIIKKLESFEGEHAKEKEQVTREFTAKINGYYEKAREEIVEYLASLGESLLKQLGAKKAEDLKKGLAKIEHIFSGVPVDNKLEESKELSKKYVGMKNRVKELITVPSNSEIPKDEIPLLTTERQTELEELLGNIPQFDSNSYSVKHVEGVKLKGEEFNLKNIFGLEATYEIVKDRELVRVSHGFIEELGAEPLLREDGFGAKLSWKIPEIALTIKGYRIMAKRGVGKGDFFFSFFFPLFLSILFFFAIVESEEKSEDDDLVPHEKFILLDTLNSEPNKHDYSYDVHHLFPGASYTFQVVPVTAEGKDFDFEKSSTPCNCQTPGNSITGNQLIHDMCRFEHVHLIPHRKSTRDGNITQT